MRFPGRRELQEDHAHAASRSEGDSTSTTHARGHIDDGSLAYEERVAEARRLWPEARLEYFERVSMRLYRDRASGVESSRSAALLADAGRREVPRAS